MSVVAAYLVPGSPLPWVCRDNPPWAALAAGLDAAGASLARAAPDTLVVYSTQWLAVLDQLWLTRPRLTGVHVDENWHEYGELPFDIHIDTPLTEAVIAATPAVGVRSKGVDYDAFPVDTGTIVAANFLNPGDPRPLVVGANNLYHDFALTRGLGEIAAGEASRLGRRIAVIGVGGMSGAFFRDTIDIRRDRLVSDADDAWNRRVLELMQRGAAEELARQCPRYAAEARVDMGFKHYAFVCGALGGHYRGATVHAYGPLYGSGGAVVEFAV